MPRLLTEIPPPARELLEGAEPAVLCTLAPDGSPRAWVMWAGLDGDDVVMTTRPQRGQARDLARDPRATVIVYDRALPSRYVEVRGRGAVERRGAEAVSARLVRQYLGHDAPPRGGPRVVLRVAIDTVVYREWE